MNHCVTNTKRFCMSGSAFWGWYTDIDLEEMINIERPVIFDCVVDKSENCFPVIPSGKPHNQMILGPEEEEEISDEGKILV